MAIAVCAAAGMAHGAERSEAEAETVIAEGEIIHSDIQMDGTRHAVFIVRYDGRVHVCRTTLDDTNPRVLNTCWDTE